VVPRNVTERGDRNTRWRARRAHRRPCYSWSPHSVCRPALTLSIVALLAGLILAGCKAESEPTAEELRAVERQIEDVLTVHTFEHSYRSIVYFGEQRRFLFMDTMDRQVLFGIDVRVLAGINLSEGIVIRRAAPARRAQDVERLFVTLPPARIMLVDAQEESITEYFETDRGGGVGLLEYGEEIENAKATSREAALADGILRQAEANARVIVEEFLNLAGFDGVEIRVREREEDELRG